jgi:hypothetical protein
MTFNINNVASFRGFDVRNGQVDISNEQYRDLLDEIYGDTEVCGMSYSAGRALQILDEVAFRCGLGDYESEIQTELEEAIENEDESEIEWEDGKESQENNELI